MHDIETTGFSSLDMERVLQSSRFTDRIMQLAEFTLEAHTGGGLAVYKQPAGGRLTVSPVSVPSEADIALSELFNSSWNAETAVMATEPREAYDGWRITRAGMSCRSDIALYIHSHPAEGGDAGGGLMPSVSDLWLYDAIRGSSPRLVAGILVPAYQNKEHRLLLCRARKATDYNSVQFEDRSRSDPAKAHYILRKNGFNTATARLDSRGRRLITNVGFICSRLFAKTTPDSAVAQQ